MEQLIQQLINRLVALESEFDSLPDLSIIQELIKEIEALKQNETFTKETLKDAVTMFGNGYITTKSDELFTKLNETFNKLSDDNSSHTETKSSELGLKIDGLFQEFKTDLNKRFYKELLDFKEKADEHQLKIDDMVQNALVDIKLKLRDVKNGRDGIDGKDGIGIKGDKGDKGLDGASGIGIDDITYKSNTITIFLSNGTKKEIRLNIPTYLGGGGGISETRVIELINGSLDSAINDLINGASNVLDSFGEVESTLNTLQSSINANTQAIANLATAQGEFGSLSSQIVTTSEQNLSFDVFIPSTDPTIINFDDTLNRCYFGINASFNFRTDMIFDVNTNQPVTVTIRGRNVLDNSIVYSRTVDINQPNNTSKQISTNTLLTLGKNGFPNSPLNIYFTVQADNNGITIHEFNSILTSSSSYVANVNNVLPTVTKTSDYIATTDDYTIRCDCSLNDINITLPSANNQGLILVIKRIDSSPYKCNIIGNIDGGANALINKQYTSLQLQANGVSYDIL